MLSGGERSGFTLIGLLLVLTVVGIAGLMAGPSLHQARISANESAALGYLNDWSLAQSSYHLGYGHYAHDERQLDEEGLFPRYNAPGNPIKSLIGYFQQGYRFQLENPPGSRYRWWGRAQPIVPGVDGVKYFYVDETGVIRYSVSGPAEANSPPL